MHIIVITFSCQYFSESSLIGMNDMNDMNSSYCSTVGLISMCETVLPVSCLYICS